MLFLLLNRAGGNIFHLAVVSSLFFNGQANPDEQSVTWVYVYSIPTEGNYDPQLNSIVRNKVS